jgi:hypothetical protein
MLLRTSFVLLALTSLFAQSKPDATQWRAATELPGLDQSGLSVAQKRNLLDLLRAEPCNCGCTLKIAECRIKDPNCTRSRGLAGMAAQKFREGKTAQQARADLEQRLNEAPSVLGNPVAIPITGAPVKGAANARITLVEFSDFQ